MLTILEQLWKELPENVNAAILVWSAIVLMVIAILFLLHIPMTMERMLIGAAIMIAIYAIIIWWYER